MSNRNALVMPPPRPSGRSQTNQLATNSGDTHGNQSRSLMSPHSHAGSSSETSYDRSRSFSGADRSNMKSNGRNEMLQGRGSSQFRFTQLPTASSLSKSTFRACSTIDRRPDYQKSSSSEPLRSTLQKPLSDGVDQSKRDGKPTDDDQSSESILVMDDGTQVQELSPPTATPILVRGDNDGGQTREADRSAGNPPRRSSQIGVEASRPLPTQRNANGRGSVDFKRDLKVVTTSLESCMQFHKKIDYHPALLFFKTYGVLSSGPETPDRDATSRLGPQNVVLFELFERRSDSYLSCYFLETERRLPAVCMGRTYTVVGQFLKEEGVGDFKVLTISEATPDNGIRQNLFNFNDQLLRKLSLS